MESILYEIFTGRYDAQQSRSDKQREVQRLLAPLEDKIQEAFGLEFLEQFNTVQDDMEVAQGYSSFRSGFLLGARLMLEALKPC